MFHRRGYPPRGEHGSVTAMEPARHEISGLFISYRSRSAPTAILEGYVMHDVSIPAAMIAGLVSFLSPCVLPLVPPYLIYLTGATI